jgi:2-polyprenyl-3-methyl-5-hydroxy-6-metoxy-1,4-benzoquinol methylase
MAEFFDQYPRFYNTSRTSPSVDRLSFRYHLIIEQNRSLIEGKKVLDLGAHDGRWSFAAIKAGAASVYGIEPRKRLVDNANATFAEYGVPASAYKFVRRDGYRELERLERTGEKFDTAMVLGFLYHTAREYEVIYRLARLACSAIIVDTRVLRNVKEQPIIRLALESTKAEGSLFSAGKPVDLAAIPSLPAVHLMLKAAGYQPSTIAPSRPIPEAHCVDYKTGIRFTVVGVK